MNNIPRPFLRVSDFGLSHRLGTGCPPVMISSILLDLTGRTFVVPSPFCSVFVSLYGQVIMRSPRDAPSVYLTLRAGCMTTVPIAMQQVPGKLFVGRLRQLLIRYAECSWAARCWM